MGRIPELSRSSAPRAGFLAPATLLSCMTWSWPGAGCSARCRKAMAARCTPPVVERLKEVLVTHPGPTQVHLKLRGHERTTVVRLDDKLRVAASPALIGDLKQLLGPACVS